MDLFSIFKSGKYFDKHIEPKCDYCRFGKRAKDGNKVLCEKRGLVDANYSCNKFIYSPLKRIPVKQLNFVGSLADEDLYIESAGDRAEKEEELNKADDKEKKAVDKKKEEKKAEEKSEDKKPEEKKAEEAVKTEQPGTPENAPEAPKSETNAEAAPTDAPEAKPAENSPAEVKPEEKTEDKSAEQV